MRSGAVEQWSGHLAEEWGGAEPAAAGPAPRGPRGVHTQHSALCQVRAYNLTLTKT